eukprot:2296484-Prorocentrum_lima.AAC.1
MQWQKPASNCVKPTCSPNDVGVISPDDVHADSASPTDAVWICAEHPVSSVHHAAPTTTSKLASNHILPMLKEKVKVNHHNIAGIH